MTAANQAAYRAWIHSHTVEEIKQANSARRKLKRKSASSGLPKPPRSKLTLLIDDRKTKSPVSPYLAFLSDRYASGDYKGLRASDASRLAAEEWKTLDATEKQVSVMVHLVCELLLT